MKAPKKKFGLINLKLMKDQKNKDYVPEENRP